MSDQLQTDNCTVETSGPSSSPKERKPGELFFSILVTVFGALGYFFALDLSSDDYSSPAVFPKAVSVIIMCGGLASFLQALKQQPQSGQSLWAYLMPRNVQVMLGLMIAYCLALPYLHFPATSFIFLVISLSFLYKGQYFFKLCLYAAISVACLILLFRYVMLVILP